MTESDDRAAVPSPQVWEGIHRTLGLDPAFAEDPLSATAPSIAPHVVPRKRVRRRILVGVAMAAAIVLAALAGVAIGVRVSAPTGTTIAEAALDPMPGWSATGTATVQQTADGARYVVIDLAGAATDGQLREVWLIRSDEKGLVSLGFLHADSGRFSIPSQLDLAQYDIVDVSAEPDDGDPAHSGDSIVRGTLSTV